MKRLVELGGKGRVRNTAEVVVGLDVFLDCLTAVVIALVSRQVQVSAAAHTRLRGCDSDGAMRSTNLDPLLSLS